MKKKILIGLGVTSLIALGVYAFKKIYFDSYFDDDFDDDFDDESEDDDNDQWDEEIAEEYNDDKVSSETELTDEQLFKREVEKLRNLSFIELEELKLGL